MAGHGAVRTIVPLLGKPVDAGRWVRTGARDPLSAAVVGLFRAVLSARPVVAPEPLPEALCPAAGECGKETARRALTGWLCHSLCGQVRMKMMANAIAIAKVELVKERS